MKELFSPGKEADIEIFKPLRRFWKTDDEAWLHKRKAEWALLFDEEHPNILLDYWKAYYLYGGEPPSSVLFDGADEPFLIEFSLYNRMNLFPFYETEDVKAFYTHLYEANKFDKHLHSSAKHFVEFYKPLPDGEARAKLIIEFFYSEQFYVDRAPKDKSNMSVVAKPEEFYRLFIGHLYRLNYTDRHPLLWQFFTKEYFEYHLPFVYDALKNPSPRDKKFWDKKFGNFVEELGYVRKDKLSGRHLDYYNYVIEHIYSEDAPALLKEALAKHK